MAPIQKAGLTESQSAGFAAEVEQNVGSPSMGVGSRDASDANTKCSRCVRIASRSRPYMRELTDLCHGDAADFFIVRSCPKLSDVFTSSESFCEAYNLEKLAEACLQRCCRIGLFAGIQLLQY